MSTEAEKRATRNYERGMVKQYNLRLNRRTDADVIARLEAQASKMGYLKRLVREDIERER